MKLPSPHAIAVSPALVLIFYLFPLHGASVKISDADVLSGFSHPVPIAI